MQKHAHGILELYKGMRNQEGLLCVCVCVCVCVLGLAAGAPHGNGIAHSVASSAGSVLCTLYLCFNLFYR